MNWVENQVVTKLVLSNSVEDIQLLCAARSNSALKNKIMTIVAKLTKAIEKPIILEYNKIGKTQGMKTVNAYAKFISSLKILQRPKERNLS